MAQDGHRKASDLADQFLVRMPDGLRDRIALAANRRDRSMNAEIVATLEKAYPKVENLPKLLDDIDSLFGKFKARNTSEASRKLILDTIHTLSLEAWHNDDDGEAADDPAGEK